MLEPEKSLNGDDGANRYGNKFDGSWYGNDDGGSRRHLNAKCNESMKIHYLCFLSRFLLLLLFLIFYPAINLIRRAFCIHSLQYTRVSPMLKQPEK
jgi:hypothetical protein